jgi:hypothetical protein
MNVKIKALIQILIILAIGLAAMWFSSLFTKETPTDSAEIAKEVVKEVVKEIVLKKPSCPNTTEAFETLKNNGQTVTLAKDRNTYGDGNGAFVNPKITVVKSTGSGSQIACGYLYVQAQGSNGRLLQVEWEHPYVKPGQFGGHIQTSNSIIPMIDGETNKFLFNLSNINYRLKNSDTEVLHADWAALLNVSNRIQFDLSLNTADKGGRLDEVSIVYQCWSPETGQITHDCRLSVE